MRWRELLWLLPALALYIVLIAAFATDEPFGDEGRYLGHAKNLTHGFYTPRDEPRLIAGPGYPLVLTPWVAVGAPRLAMKLLNGPFLFIGVCLMYMTARMYAGRAVSLVFAWLLAIYPPFLRHLPYILTETLATALICCFVFFLARWYRTRRVGWLIGSALAFAYLALTKIFFGWVIMFGCVVFLLLSLARPLRPLWRTGVALALAFVLCTPYLAYTYWLTGTPLLWGEGGFGGRTPIYFMTTPYADEYGDWWSTADVMTNPSLARHKPLFEELASLSLNERQDRLRQEALKNIRRAPLKCLMNWALNVTRMLFSYPYSHTPQKPSTFFYLVPNMFLVALMVFLVYPTVAGRRCIPPEVFALLLIAFVALGGSSLLSASARFFAVGVPMLAVWILVTLVRVVRVRLVCDLPTAAGAAPGAGEGTGRTGPTSLEPGVKGNSDPTDPLEEEQRGTEPADGR